MFRFRDSSIKRKLTVILMVVSTVGLLMACAAFVLNDVITLRHAMIRELSIMARLIGANSTAPLVFNDQRFVADMLAELRAEPHIVAAIVYEKDDQVFSTYHRGDAQRLHALPTPQETGYHFGFESLELFQTINLDGEKIGIVYLHSDLQALYVRLARYIGIVALIILASSLVVFVLSSVLQRLVSDPILRLASIARTVSENRDYSIRAAKHSQDEVGILVDGFNDMLAQVQDRDMKLEGHREHLEDQVAVRTAELRQVNRRLETATQHKSEFLASMSHELRTPLNAIIGFSEMLLEKPFGQLNQKQEEFLGYIFNSGRHLLSLINDILDLSKIEAGRMELQLVTFNLPAALENALALVRDRANRHGITFAFELDERLGDCIADERKVRQILLNLLSNAVKFTPDGGTITLRAKLTEQVIQVSVTDTGVGIAPDDQQRIFDEFYQVPSEGARKGEGTGLGLALARSLIELQGGSIQVKSKLGDGSTFTFTLPARASMTAVPVGAGVTREVSRVDSLEHVRALILIVEDNEESLTLMRNLLGSSGYRTMDAASAEAALEIAHTHPPDLILMDIQLPGMDGITALHALREDPMTQRIPVIALTAQAMLHDQERIHAAGFDAYQTKPIRMKEFLTVVERLLSARLRQSP